MNTSKTKKVEERPYTLIERMGISSIKRSLLFLGCFLFALAVYWVTSPEKTGMTPAANRALFILVFAACLWVTDAVQAFSVGILIIGLQILLLGKPGGVFSTTERDWEQFVMVLGHPLIWLFFGGFVMAAGLARTGLSRLFASWLMARVGNKPRAILGGVMAITFVLSMFISNTATTAMMLAIITPLLGLLQKDDRFSTGLILGVAVAANLGGMGSLIGSPPNAIAVGDLVDLTNGPQINFLDWMIIGLPLGIVLLVIAYIVIFYLYPSQMNIIEFKVIDSASDISSGSDPLQTAPLWQRLVMIITMALTVGLWMTSQWHKLPTAVVSFIPIIFLTATGILGNEEIRGLSYDVLFLLAGGLALGHMVMETGLSSWIVDRLPMQMFGAMGATLVMVYITVLLSNFMSNTAAANILIPISVTLAMGFEARMAVSIALAASTAMCFPISTPPNALAYGTGVPRTKEFLFMGLLMGLLGPMLGIFWTFFIVDRLLF